VEVSVELEEKRRIRTEGALTRLKLTGGRRRVMAERVERLDCNSGLFA